MGKIAFPKWFTRTLDRQGACETLIPLGLKACLQPAFIAGGPDLDPARHSKNRVIRSLDQPYAGFSIERTGPMLELGGEPERFRQVARFRTNGDHEPAKGGKLSRASQKQVFQALSLSPFSIDEANLMLEFRFQLIDDAGHSCAVALNRLRLSQASPRINQRIGGLRSDK